MSIIKSARAEGHLRGQGAALDAGSGNDRECAELAEVNVEGEGGRDPEALDHNPTDAVGEAPAFSRYDDPHGCGSIRSPR